jgi:hypothetical protein
MANKTITQRIALEGSDEVRRGLEQLGQAGQDAFKKLQDAQNANSVLARLGASLDAFKAKAADLGNAGRRLGSDIGTLGERFASLAAKAGLAAGVSITGLAVGFAHLVAGAAESADALRETAEQVGLTADQLSNLQFAFIQNGVGSDALTKGLLKLTNAMREAQTQEHNKSKQLRNLNDDFARGKISLESYMDSQLKLRRDAPQSIFDKLGISVTNADGTLRNTRDTMLDLADVFQKLPDGAEKTAAALQIGSSKNAKFVSTLNLGRQGIIALEKEAERVAPPLNKLQLLVGDEMRDAFDTLVKASQSAKNALLLLFAPAGTELARALTEAIVSNREAAFSFAAALADRVKPVVDDIVALLKGRDADVKNTFLVQMRDQAIKFGKDFASAISDLIVPAIKTLLATLDILAQGFNAIFGTQLTGQALAVALVLTKLSGAFGLVTASVRVIISLIGLFVAAFGAVPITLAIIGVALGAFLVNAVGGLEGIRNAWNATWNAIGSFVSGVFSGLIAAAQAVWNGITSGVAAAGAAIVGFFTGLPALLVSAFQALVALAASVWDSIVQGAKSLGQGIVDAFTSALDTVTGAFHAMFDTVSGWLSTLLSLAQTVFSAVAGAFGGGGAGFAAGGPVGFAGGGAVRGPGSSTSDSISARLSDGEYVIRAPAVSHYGAGFFDSLNAMRLRMSDLRERFGNIDFANVAQTMAAPLGIGAPRFASGGLVAAGAASGGHPFTLNIDGTSIGGLTASPDALKQLTRYAVRSRTLSAGRKPSSFGR